MTIPAHTPKNTDTDPDPDALIPIAVRKRWMALLVDAVRRTGTLNINFSEITMTASDVRAHQVMGYIRITDETIGK